jgi:hypothetical protein
MAPSGYTASSSHLADAELCNEPLDRVDGRRHLGRGTKGTSACQALLLCACVALQTFQKLRITRGGARQHDGCMKSATRARHLASAPLDVHMILLLLHRGLALRKQLYDTRSVMQTDMPSEMILRTLSQSPVRAAPIASAHLNHILHSAVIVAVGAQRAFQQSALLRLHRHTRRQKQGQ